MGHNSSEATALVFEPDCILPSQFYNKDDAGPDAGERRLMAALLADGVEAYIAHWSSVFARSALGSGHTEEIGEATLWVDTRDFGYVFSFDNVCESLGINPEYLRAGLLRFVRALERKREAGDTASLDSCWKKIRRPRK